MVFTVAMAARRLRVSTQYVYKAIQTQRIPASREYHRWLIEERDLEEYERRKAWRK